MWDALFASPLVPTEQRESTPVWELEASTQPRDVLIRRDPGAGSFGVTILSTSKATDDRHHITGVFIGSLSAAHDNLSGGLRVGDEVLAVEGEVLGGGRTLSAADQGRVHSAHEIAHNVLLVRLRARPLDVLLTVRHNPQGFALLKKDPLGVPPASPMTPRASLFARNASIATIDEEHEQTEVLLGLQAVRQKAWAEAAEHFLAALNLYVSEYLARRICEAARFGSTEEANLACFNLLETEKKAKAGVYYLLGMVYHRLQNQGLSSLAFERAVKLCCPWFLGEFSINTEAAHFHFVVSEGLVAQHKFLIAAVALRQAVFLQPAQSEWRKTLLDLLQLCSAEELQLFSEALPTEPVLLPVGMSVVRIDADKDVAVDSVEQCTDFDKAEQLIRHTNNLLDADDEQPQTFDEFANIDDRSADGDSGLQGQTDGVEDVVGPVSRSPTLHHNADDQRRNADFAVQPAPALSTTSTYLQPGVGANQPSYSPLSV